MNKFNLEQLDFSKESFSEISERLFPEAVKKTKDSGLIYIQRPAVESAYYSELFSAFLEKKGLKEEWKAFKGDPNEVQKYFRGGGMQVEYASELEWLEERYNTIIYNIEVCNRLKLGDEVWYHPEDGEKVAGTVQSKVVYDGYNHFVDLEINGKFVPKRLFDRVSRRW